MIPLQPIQMAFPAPKPYTRYTPVAFTLPTRVDFVECLADKCSLQAPATKETPVQTSDRLGSALDVGKLDVDVALL